MLKGVRFLEIMCQERIYNRISVLNESAVGIGIDAPSRTGNDDPSTALGTFRATRSKGSVFVLHSGKACKGFLGCGGNRRLFSVGIQSGQSHTGYIGIGSISKVGRKRPTSIIVLKREYRIYALLTNGSVRGCVMIGIKRDKRPNSSV